MAQSGWKADYPDDGESLAVQNYETKKASIRSGAISSPYCPFPPVMNAYGGHHLVSTRSLFDICGASKDERLYAVEFHFGFSGRGPLGIRPGANLHNGPSFKDPILAATGGESRVGAKGYMFDLNHVVLLPDESGMVTEHMRSATARDGNVVFRFSIEVGPSDIRRKFEWRKVKKGVDGMDAGGYRLVRLPPRPLKDQERKSTGNKEGECSTPAKEPETFATLKWIPGWGKLTHQFSLELVGKAQSDKVGERFKLMVVMTAVRIQMLRIAGRAKKSVISVGEMTGK